MKAKNMLPLLIAAVVIACLGAAQNVATVPVSNWAVVPTPPNMIGSTVLAGSPDGIHVLLAVKEKAKPLTSRLFLADAATGVPEAEYTPEQGERYSDAVFGESGASVTFAVQNRTKGKETTEIVSGSLDRRERRVLCTLGSQDRVWSLAWSPDGKRLAIARESSKPGGYWATALSILAAGSLSDVIRYDTPPSPPPTAPCFIRNVVWLDDHRLAANAWGMSVEDGALYVVDVDEHPSQMRLMRKDMGILSSLSISPDRLWLAYNRGGRGGGSFLLSLTDNREYAIHANKDLVFVCCWLGSGVGTKLVAQRYYGPVTGPALIPTNPEHVEPRAWVATINWSQLNSEVSR